MLLWLVVRLDRCSLAEPSGNPSMESAAKEYCVFLVLEDSNLRIKKKQVLMDGISLAFEPGGVSFEVSLSRS